MGGGVRFVESWTSFEILQEENKIMFFAPQKIMVNSSYSLQLKTTARSHMSDALAISFLFYRYWILDEIRLSKSLQEPSLSPSSQKRLCKAILCRGSGHIDIHIIFIQKEKFLKKNL